MLNMDIYKYAFKKCARKENLFVGHRIQLRYHFERRLTYKFRGEMEIF